MNRKFLFITIVVLSSYNARSQKILKPIWTNTFAGGYSELSADNKKILTRSTGITIFSTETKKALTTITDAKGQPIESHFDKSGKYVAAAAKDVIQIWDSESGLLLNSFGEKERTIRSFQYDSSGTRIITLIQGDSICKIWDVVTGKIWKELRGHKSAIMSVISYPSKNWLLTVSLDRKAKIWDLESGKTVQTFPYTVYDIKKAKMSSDGNKVVTLTGDKQVQIWDIVSGSRLYTLSQYPGFVNDVEIDEKGEKAVTISENNIIRIWDLTTGKELKALTGHTKNITSVVLSKQGDKLLSISDDSTCKLWDANSGTMIKSIKGEKGLIAHANFNKLGDMFSLSNLSGECSVWSSSTADILFFLKGEYSIDGSVASTDGDAVYFTNYMGRLNRWNTKTNEIRTIEPYKGAITGFGLMNGGKQILTVGDSTAKIWTSDSLHFVRDLMKGEDALSSVYFPQKNNLVFIRENHQRLTLWNTETSKMVQQLVENGIFQNGVGVTDGEKYMVLTNTLQYVYEFKNGKYEYVGLLKWTGGVRQIAFIENGEKIITVENSVKVWEASTTDTAGTIAESKIGPVMVLPTKDGQRILISYYDGTICMWNIKSSDTPLYTINESPGYYGQIRMILSKDGTKVFSAIDDGQYRIWDTETGELLAELSSEWGKVDFMEFINNDTQLFTYAGVGGVKLWDVGNLHPSTVSENRDNKFNNVSIFPNPASDKITIRMPERTHGTTQYTITNQTGNIVRIGALPGSINELDTSISNLPNGLYVFSVEINGKRMHQKFIIAR